MVYWRVTQIRRWPIIIWFTFINWLDQWLVKLQYDYEWYNASCLLLVHVAFPESRLNRQCWFVYRNNEPIPRILPPLSRASHTLVIVVIACRLSKSYDEGVALSMHPGEGNVMVTLIQTRPCAHVLSTQPEYLPKLERKSLARVTLFETRAQTSKKGCCYERS